LVDKLIKNDGDYKACIILFNNARQTTFDFQ